MTVQPRSRRLALIAVGAAGAVLLAALVEDTDLSCG
jgi:hypothetical protein